MKLEKSTIIGLLVAANMIGAVTVGSAVAEETKKPNYVQAKMGFLYPTSGLDDADYDTGFYSGLSYGRYLTKHLILEGTVDASLSKNDLTASNGFTGNYSQKNDLWITSFLLTLKDEYTIGRVNLYGGGGIGVYVVNLTSKTHSNRFGTFKEDGDDTVFGVHLVAGANYDITQSWFVGVEGGYRWTEDAKIEKNAVGVPVGYNDDINGLSLAATLGYRF